MTKAHLHAICLIVLFRGQGTGWWLNIQDHVGFPCSFLKCLSVGDMQWRGKAQELKKQLYCT